MRERGREREGGAGGREVGRRERERESERERERGERERRERERERKRAKKKEREKEKEKEKDTRLRGVGGYDQLRATTTHATRHRRINAELVFVISWHINDTVFRRARTPPFAAPSASLFVFS